MQKSKNRGRKNAVGYIFCVTAAVIIAAAAVIGAIDFSVPDKVAFINDGSAENADFTSEENAAEALNSEGGVKAAVESYSAKARVGVLPIKEVTAKVYADTKLVPCGSIFGIKFFTKGVLVVGTSEVETADGRINPAEKAGLKAGDSIGKVNGVEVNTVEEMAKLIETSGGEVLVLSVERDGEFIETSLLPALSLSDKKYKSGLWIRDSTAGIGTVTYYDPKSGAFAGLGHGICDIDTGKLMPLLRATVVDITLDDVIKGEKGRPGELKGSFGAIKRGSLIGNTQLGVYGFYDSSPVGEDAAAVSITLADGVKEGAAEIYSSIDANGVEKYKIEITKLYKNDNTNKSFVFKITDKRLIDSTGGIVQGMSGSPILQDGHLIGAVTHVMVNDPEKGYGVYIENMLGAAPEMLG